MSGQGPPASGPDLCSLGFTVPCARVLNRAGSHRGELFFWGPAFPYASRVLQLPHLTYSVLLWLLSGCSWWLLTLKLRLDCIVNKARTSPQPLDFGCLQLPFFLRAGAVVGCVTGMALKTASLKVESWVFHLLVIWPWASYLSLRTEYPHLDCGFSYTYSAV